jgi:hypothetical protein
MAKEMHLWRVGPEGDLTEIQRASLDLEARLQDWLARDISILDPGLLVIGREVETDFGGFIDLLCMDSVGDLVVIELKRDKTPREITAQALDYGSWVADLSNERVTATAEAYLGEKGFEQAFSDRFKADVPETLNGEHRLLIVGSQIDPSSERIITYLSDRHGVNINAATFQYFREPDGIEFVGRVFLIDPSEVELSTRIKGKSKRRHNLTYDELAKLADESGVQDLYHHAVATFDRDLKKHTTRSSVAFTGDFDGSRKAVVSLLPGDSSADEGLRYQIYSNRFGTLTGLAEAQVEALMPQSHVYWSYTADAGPDWEGFQGFIKDPGEIDRLGNALSVTRGKA